MSDVFAPCQSIEHSQSASPYSIIFSNFDAMTSELEAQGGQGGSHSLDAMVRAVLEMRSIQFPDVLFDPESDMFAAASKSKESLQKIASIIREIVSNVALRTDAIAHAKKQGYFE